MTEQEWLACTAPAPMLEFLRGKVSERKLRLFAVGCCRPIQQRVPDERCRHAIEVAERFADGMATERELRCAGAVAHQSLRENNKCFRGHPFAELYATYFAARTAVYASYDTALEAAVGAARTLFSAAVDAAGEPDVYLEARMAAGDAVRQYYKQLFNDIFGPLPFRPVGVDPAWLRWDFGTVVSIAHHIYEERAFHDMPILADALEDAGCTDADILCHCRSEGPHVGGCWVIDLLLGKE